MLQKISLVKNVAKNDANNASKNACKDTPCVTLDTTAHAFPSS